MELDGCYWLRQPITSEQFHLCGVQSYGKFREIVSYLVCVVIFGSCKLVKFCLSQSNLNRHYLCGVYVCFLYTQLPHNAALGLVVFAQDLFMRHFVDFTSRRKDTNENTARDVKGVFSIRTAFVCGPTFKMCLCLSSEHAYKVPVLFAVLGT